MRAMLLALLFLEACFWRGALHPADEAGSGIEALVAEVVPPGAATAVFGLRDGTGKRTPLTRLLDAELLSALVRSGGALSLVEGDETWKPEEGLPTHYWTDLEAPVLVVGQVQEDSTWVYVRLQALERKGGRVLGAQTLRLEGQPLRQRLSANTVAAEAGISVQLHTLVLHQAGGFDQQVPLEDHGRLQVGDRLQLRFRTGSDCQVFAFLYSSQGEQQNLFDRQQVYKGRLQETAWLTLNNTNQVYTLYLIAASHLDEDQGELFENLAELVSQGKVTNYTGVEQLDQALSAFLTKHSLGQGAVQVQRQAGELGSEEKFILGEGTVLKSKAQQLRATEVLVQALSFEVQ